jgi:carbamoyl-phosphate synthase large subunit
MASADDLPTAFAKAERAAGRPLPATGTVFLSVRDADKAAIVPVAHALVALGFRLLATHGTADALEAAGIEVAHADKGDAVVDAIRAGRCSLVVNTPQGSGARRDGARIRQAALSARITCITTLAAARLAVDAIANARSEVARPLQERLEVETAAA